MPALHVVAGFLGEITPPPRAPFERAFETSPEGFRCTFRDGTVAWLRPGPGQTTRLGILEGRRQRKAPVYVELDEALAIVTLGLPRIVKASRPREQPNGDLEFELFPSQCVHRLVRGHRDFAALGTALEQGRARDQWLLVTGTDTHEIIHVALVPPRDLAERDLPEEPGVPAQLARLVARWRQWYRDRRIELRAAAVWPTEAQAQQLFNLVAAKSCATTSPASDCMAFLYPDDGCKARAHEMCRLIGGEGFTPRKIWIVAPGIEKFSVATPNSPACTVGWWHHVAPLLKVVTNAGVLADYVIDPALFNGPVLRTDWVTKIQGSNPQQPTTRPWDYYYPGKNDMDPGFKQTKKDLDEVRDLFVQRCLDRGSPPYAC